MQVNEYLLNYHIDGSQGQNVKWIASEQPSSKFSLFESPQVFFVSSSNGFEGCGYRQEIVDKEIIAGMNKKLGTPDLCNGKNIYVFQASYESYSKISLHLSESKDKFIITMIFVKPEFGDKENILSNLGCKV